ncbi:DUF411 domain-containing protein [Endozoicomonadaceae bacterium StTr2]
MKKLRALALGASLILTSVNSFAEKLPMVMLFKSPTCGCCTEWAKHMEDNGFKVMNHDVQNISRYKQKAGVPAELQSCHTAMIGNYAIEGHVPAADIIRLLQEQPESVKGLAVPGMPVGSPGMEYGNRKDDYNVVSFGQDGQTSVYARH